MGIYHAVSQKHLHRYRYLAHAEFLWNNRELEDGERLVATIKASDRDCRFKDNREEYRDPKQGPETL